MRVSDNPLYIAFQLIHRTTDHYSRVGIRLSCDVLFDPAVHGCQGGARTAEAPSQVGRHQSSRSVYVPILGLRPADPFYHGSFSIVFLTFWQATFLSVLTLFGVVKDVGYLLVICVYHLLTTTLHLSRLRT